MRPLPFMTPIAEYANRWEANVAAARLREAGFEATVLVDPATDVAPHHVTERMAVLTVRSEAAEAAGEVLGLNEPRNAEVERLDAAYYHRRFKDRPKWVRYTTWALIIAVPAPLAIATLLLIWLATTNLLFP